MTDQTAEPELTGPQKAYNVAQSEMFQLAAYGHHRYHPSGEALTDEGKRQQRDYNDRIRAAREQLEATLLRLVAEHAETFTGKRVVSVEWLRSLADDPAALSLLAVRPDERDFDTDPAATPAGPAPAPDRAALRQPAYDAVFAYIRQQPRDRVPTTIVDRNAMIWRAVHAALDAVLPAPVDRAAVLLEAADRIDRTDLPQDFVDMFDNGARWATSELRRLAGEEQQDPTKDDCTCGVAGDAFVPAGHYRDCPEYAREAQQDETQAQPPHHRWSVETRDAVADQWAPGTPITDRDKAVERYEHVTKNWPTWKDGTPVQRRLVRATTTYAVEQGAVARSGQPETDGETDRA